MGKCAKCYEIYPPDYMFDINENDKECVFCKIGKDEVTVDRNGTRVKIKKDECSKEYKKALRRLAEKSKKASKILAKGKIMT